jgi:alanyl-tRNA synthetase
LPKPSIDTGAGLERLASVVQGKSSNYGVDLLEELVLTASDLAKKHYGGTMAPDDVSMRVIADHARTCAFLIAEGVLPDRTARPYVLRRVMRRAIRHGHRLGISDPFLHRVTAHVVSSMGEQYPELRERAELIESVTLAEEVRFRQTIERGLSLLNERFDHLEQNSSAVLSGEDAFRLYDTFGFPLDLTEVICAERGISVDGEGYQAELKRARARSTFVSQDRAVESVYRSALSNLASGQVVFTGYDREQDQAMVASLVVEGRLVDSLDAASGQIPVEVVLESTCFYAESGGQVGDSGVIVVPGGEIRVDDTQKPTAGLIVHRGALVSGSISVGQRAELVVDAARRARIRRNHSATHLVHWALRQVLGAHAQQKGSLVGPERLRFDFTHNAPLSQEEIVEIERLVNREVLMNHPIQTEVLTMDQARTRGAVMIFEEKYGDVVRMLSMGPSTELCGGTHARATGEIGLVKIVSDHGVAAGVRRLFATTGEGSLAHLQGIEAQVVQLADLLRSTPDNLGDRIEKLLERNKGLEKEVEALKRQLLTGGGAGGVDAMLARVKTIGGVQVLGVRVDVSDRAALRELAEQLRDKLGEAVVLVGAEEAGKVALVVTVSKGLTSRFRAGDLIKSAATKVGGTGGGRPDMAQAGGTQVEGLDEAVDAVYAAVEAAS